MSEDVETPIEELKAMAHPLRFRILQALGPGERNVGEIEAETNIGQPTLSQQLAVLRKAGLVSTRKEAKLVYYRVAAERLAEIAEVISGAIKGALHLENIEAITSRLVSTSGQQYDLRFSVVAYRVCK